MERKVTTYEVDDGVAVVTLNRPDRLNAWTGRMELEYRAALAEADADPEVRVIVVTGAGRGFCAGADTKALTGIRDSGVYETGVDEPLPAPGAGVRPDFEHRFSFTLGLAKPVIAAVNGPAAGVGFVLMCFADIRFAAAGAKLTTSFGRLGLPAEHAVSWVLPRLVGTARAADLLFSSRVVLAEEAEAMGLVNRTLPAEELLPFTLDYAKRMAAEISPWSLRAMKRQLYADVIGDLDTAARRAVELMDESFTGVDFKEGVAALTEKRAPVFAPLAPQAPRP
ncbi:MAG TPA: enoyl-CoA hydratase-related protein [Acidimicrobiales bacterium]